jgi:hypothetical protein
MLLDPQRVFPITLGPENVSRATLVKLPLAISNRSGSIKVATEDSQEERAIILVAVTWEGQT